MLRLKRAFRCSLFEVDAMKENGMAAVLTLLKLYAHGCCFVRHYRPRRAEAVQVVSLIVVLVSSFVTGEYMVHMCVCVCVCVCVCLCVWVFGGVGGGGGGGVCACLCVHVY